MGKPGQRAHPSSNYFFVDKLINRFRSCKFILIEYVSLQHFLKFDLQYWWNFFSHRSRGKKYEKARVAPYPGHGAHFSYFLPYEWWNRNFLYNRYQNWRNVAGIHFLSAKSYRNEIGQLVQSQKNICWRSINIIKYLPKKWARCPDLNNAEKCMGRHAPYTEALHAPSGSFPMNKSYQYKNRWIDYFICLKPS